MTQRLASGKVGSQRYGDNDPNKPCPAIDDIQTAQQFQRCFEEIQGYCLSNEGGSSDSQNENLSIITAENVSDYDTSLAQLIQTYVANDSYLNVDGSSTANNIILTPRKIADINSPDGVNYSKTTSLPFTYRDNLRFRFRATATNTGATQISIVGLAGLSGSIDLVDENGSNLTGGEVVTNKFYEVILTGASGTKKAVLISDSIRQFINSPSFRNVLINGGMQIDQRNAGNSQTITAGAALAYTVDQWYAYCTGANVTGQQVAGTTPNANNYRFTGAASVTKIGFAQRVEAANSQFLANKTATLSVDLANSLLTTVTWTAYYANSSNAFGTLASPTKTQIATGTFTVNSTLTRYSANISIPLAATTGIEIEFSVGAQTSGTWTIGRVQLEEGSYATPFERRSFGEVLDLCETYCEKSYELLVTPGSITTTGAIIAPTQASQANPVNLNLKKRKFGVPTITIYSYNSGTSGKVYTGSADVDGSVANTSTSNFNVRRTVAAATTIDFGFHYLAVAVIP